MSVIPAKPGSIGRRIIVLRLALGRNSGPYPKNNWGNGTSGRATT
jgi:hypothetical protein